MTDEPPAFNRMVGYTPSQERMSFDLYGRVTDLTREQRRRLEMDQKHLEKCRIASLHGIQREKEQIQKELREIQIKTPHVPSKLKTEQEVHSSRAKTAPTNRYTDIDVKILRDGGESKVTLIDHKDKPTSLPQTSHSLHRPSHPGSKSSHGRKRSITPPRSFPRIDYSKYHHSVPTSIVRRMKEVENISKSLEELHTHKYNYRKSLGSRESTKNSPNTSPFASGNASAEDVNFTHEDERQDTRPIRRLCQILKAPRN